jgi:6-phosphogluconate dehydrogenase
VEFTGPLCNDADQKTRKRQLEKRLQTVRREDSACWASLAARELEVPTPTIDAAVGTRNLSEWEKRNDFATTPFRQPLGHFGDDAESVLKEMHEALSAAIMITYAQGIALLKAGSDRYGFNIDAAEVIRLWKGCCGIRTPLLEEIASAIQATPHLPNLLHDDDLSEKVMQQQESLRHAVWRAGPLKMSVPALMASLDYLDFHRGAWLPVNLIQVPRARPCPQPQPPAFDSADFHLDWNYR